MKMLFVHDHYFKVSGETYYSGGGLPAGIWSRYLDVCSSLTVVGRDGGILEAGEKGYTVSSTEGVNFRLLPNVSNLRNLLLGNRAFRKSCESLVAESDGIIARMPSRLGTLFVREAVRQKKPYAVEVVGCAWGGLWDYGNWKAKIFAPFAALSTRNAISGAPYALYVTERFLQQRYPCKGVTTFCSNVDIPAVANKVLEDRLVKLNSKAPKLLFGLIGNYSSKYKGIDVAVRALALASNHLPEWEFQVLGAGDPSEYVDLSQKLGISERIKFIGTKASGQPIYNWLDGVDIYLQPSYQEGLPRALIEAMSRGCPALATSIAGIPELLGSGEMIQAGDYRDLAEKIASLASDAKRMEALALSNFEKSKLFYRDVLGSRRNEFWLSFRKYIESGHLH